MPGSFGKAARRVIALGALAGAIALSAGPAAADGWRRDWDGYHGRHHRHHHHHRHWDHHRHHRHWDRGRDVVIVRPAPRYYYAPPPRVYYPPPPVYYAPPPAYYGPPTLGLNFVLPLR